MSTSLTRKETERNYLANPFRWTKKALAVAALVASGESYAEAARQLEIRSARVYRWKKHPEFIAKVSEFMKDIEEEVFSVGVASKIKRIRRLNEDWQKLQKIIRDRAEKSDDMAHIPGSDTGLVVRKFRGIGQGDNFQIVEDVHLDKDVLSELRNIEEQVAKELNQVQGESSGNGHAAVIVIEVVNPSTGGNQEYIDAEAKEIT